MTIGQKIRHARLEAGLSQRALCGDKITRNMLSQIENGAANPSVDTLSYLARQLGKPVSYFLDEWTVVSPNQAVMESARAAYAAKDHAAVLQALRQFQTPDPVFAGEMGILDALSRLSLAQQALDQGQTPYALQLLTQLDTDTPYFAPALDRQRLLLLGRLPAADDRELLLRAEDALSKQLPQRTLEYLRAAEDQAGSHWNLLCGMAYLSLYEYAAAAVCLEKADRADPHTRYTALENCYRELGDFENAYRCACQLRGLEVTP